MHFVARALSPDTSGCRKLQRAVIFGVACKLECTCTDAFCATDIESLSIPDGVAELRVWRVLCVFP